jgi:hypothetical protein
MKKLNLTRKLILMATIIAIAATYTGCSSSSDNNSTSESVESTSVTAESQLAESELTESSPEEFSTDIRDDGNYEILTYNGEANIINVPESIDGIPVVEIGFNFLRGNENVVELNIPDTVEEIGYNSLCFCPNLEKITMGKNVKEIGEKFCMQENYEHLDITSCPSQLKEVTLSESLTEIPQFAFCYCYSLEKITIPESVTTINYSFGACPSLKEIHIPASVTSIAEDGTSNTMFGESKDLTIYAPSGSYAEEYAKSQNIPFVAE